MNTVPNLKCIISNEGEILLSCSFYTLLLSIVWYVREMNSVKHLTITLYNIIAFNINEHIGLT